MKEKFDPKDFASFEELPEDKKPEFEPVEGGFVKKRAIKDERKAEYMAHAENGIRSEIGKAVDEAVKNTISRVIEEADSAGKSAGNEYAGTKIRFL